MVQYQSVPGIAPSLTVLVAAGNAWDELQTEASAIAAQQRVAELTEWLGCAKIALQVSLFHRQAQVQTVVLTSCSMLTGPDSSRRVTHEQARILSCEDGTLLNRACLALQSLHALVLLEQTPNTCLLCPDPISPHACRAPRHAWAGRGGHREAPMPAQLLWTHGWSCCSWHAALRGAFRAVGCPALLPAAGATLLSWMSD